ncbi:MAG TPA: tRNA (cytidine(34)-2'-O)-methyltransferase [Chlamydiales bacterium]|nr:tRNA (cytidine(34)-2'-O)-methyltransferase [Chlamydiales bacterium]
MKIILYQPQIPQNTGTIVRTCSATNTSLVLVRPLGFSTASRHLKRAGLDYWNDVEIIEIDNLPDYLQEQGLPFFFFSSHATKMYTEAEYSPNSQLIFGSETSGLPKSYFERWPECFFTIPMNSNARCLNLSNSANIVLYEALRQTHFSDLKRANNNKESNPLVSTELAIGK